MARGHRRAVADRSRVSRIHHPSEPRFPACPALAYGVVTSGVVDAIEMEGHLMRQGRVGLHGLAVEESRATGAPGGIGVRAIKRTHLGFLLHFFEPFRNNRHDGPVF